MSTTTHDRGTLEHLCRRAAQHAGADERTAHVLAYATLEAEARGRCAVGIAHFFDYLDGLLQGRIDGRAHPRVRQVTPSVITADCRAGIAQVAFEDSYDALVQAARTHGLAMLSVENAYTCGELGYYARRLTQSALIGLAGANSPALMSIGGAAEPVLGTNPLAYGIPRTAGRALVVDQAASQTAYVNIRSAAAQRSPIPDGWAIDETGTPTTDPRAALRGALLPFGGYKGGNIALLVELLAVLSGANWSSDAPSFDSGVRSPGIGMFVIAIDPEKFGSDYRDRVDHFVDRLATRWSVDISKLEDPSPSPDCALESQLFERLDRAAAAPHRRQP